MVQTNQIAMVGCRIWAHHVLAQWHVLPHALQGGQCQTLCEARGVWPTYLALPSVLFLHSTHVKVATRCLSIPALQPQVDNSSNHSWVDNLNQSAQAVQRNMVSSFPGPKSGPWKAPLHYTH